MAQVNADADNTPNRLFSGFDSVANGMLSSSAVSGEVISEGLPVKLTIEVCQSVSELTRVLEIDSTLSVSFLKSFNATAKMEFMNSLNVTEENLTIVAYVRNGIGHYETKDVALKDDIEPPTGDKAVAEFVRSYGDSFVSAASQGGEYYAVYTFRTTSRTEKSTLTASLRMGGISGGLKFDSETQVKLTNFMKKTEVNWTFRQEMTGVTGISLPAADDMIDFALEFSSLEMNSPVTTGLAIRPYDRLPNFGNAFRKVTANRRYFLGTNGVLADLARLRNVQEQIQRLSRIYAVYGFDDPELDAFAPKVAADVATIEKQVHAWEDDATGEFVRPELPALARGEPVIDFDEGQPASFGSDTGPNFDFMPVTNAFRDRVRIASIRLAPGLWSGRYQVIRRLEVGYASANGPWTRIHGQDGSEGALFTLRDGEFPSSLRIGHGGLIDSIRVRSGSRSISGGGDGGTIVEWTPEKGSVVLGLAGRAGGALDQIRIIHAKLKPALYARAN